MIIHVLPGDSLVEEFAKTGIEGETIVFREALIVGDICAETLDEFWDIRANFLNLEYGEDPIDYREKVAYKVERLTYLPEDAEVNLWFEYELFCQANMWFCLDLLNDHGNVYRVAPLNASPDDAWKGFGNHSFEDLKECSQARQRFSDEDLKVGRKLWAAFRSRDGEELRSLGEYRSPVFPFLKEVADAAAEIETRPIELIRELKSEGLKEMKEIFPEFQKRAGVYGFGDLQVERLLHSALSNPA
ncbi:MAG: hypothetical protein IPM21_13875 [Acidobacteria bacterium]|nr:hypothetical protein [Acidobacteriota bacterium]